ncbi:MAG: choice-of-anchor D domain-containing protein [Candidatus Kapabacteria bacterium]|nr:choice-of-anchor D domain-containing protein [Candidatus Kapabacteria bacterium]
MLLVLPAIATIIPAFAQGTTATPSFLDSTQCGTQLCRPVRFTVDGAQQADSIFLAAQRGQSAQFTLQSTPFPIALNNGRFSLNLCYTPVQPSVTDTAYIVIAVNASRRDTVLITAASQTSPFLRFALQSYDFRTVTNGTSRCYSVELTNQGDNDLTILPPVGLTGTEFSITLPATTIIKPKENALITVCFQPTTTGQKSATAQFSFSPCYPPARLQLTGNSAVTAAASLGGVLQATPSPVDFDTLICGESRCKYVDVRNIGSAGSLYRRILKQPAPPYTVTIVPKDSTLLAVDSSIQLRICYTPTDTIRDVDDLLLQVDSRLPINIALLFDESGSMNDPISTLDPTKRIDAARTAGIAFVNSLLFDVTRGIVDTGAVFTFSRRTFSENTFLIRQDFTANKQRLLNAINALTLRSGTCLYYGIQRSVQLLDRRENPVLVVLSDGEDACQGAESTTMNQAIQSAISAGVKVFIVAITDSSDTGNAMFISNLKQIASRTQGEVFFARTTTEINNAYNEITKKLSQNVTMRIPLVGKANAPVPSFLPNPLRFDSVRINTTRCRTVQIRNNSSIPFYITPANFNLPPDYTVLNTPAAALQPGKTTTATICFTPRRLRVQSNTIPFGSGICNNQSLNVTGVGYDSVVVEFLDSVIGFPDEKHTFKAVLKDTVPALYGVDSVKFTLSYNATIMYPEPLPQNGENGTIRGLQSIPLKHTVTDDTAVTLSIYPQGRLVQTGFNQLLFEREFMLLNANVMESPVRITSITFADGNPKVGVIQPATVALDPACFQANRLIDSRTRRGQITLAAVSVTQPNQLDLNIGTTAQSAIEITLTDMLGRRVPLGVVHCNGTGIERHSFYLPPLAPGVYAVALFRNGEFAASQLITLP